MSNSNSDKPYHRVTVVDVAKEAGVSISAVSRAFNPKYSCSETMKKKVFAAANKLGYKPNFMARSLITAHSNLIGILVADFENPVYLPILDRFTSCIQERDCRTLLMNVARGGDITEAVELVMQYNVDGVIITSHLLSQELLEACEKQGKPVVVFGRYSKESAATVVCCDNVMGGQVVADCLLDAGYKRPAFVGGTVGASSTQDRQRGFIGRLVERGCDDWTTIQGGRHSYDAGYEAALALFNTADPPDSIFFVDDIMACGGMDAIRYECGLRVPDDVGIIGFDDIRFASSRSYNLTTIRQPFDDMVSTTVDMLFARIEDKSLAPERKFLPCELIKRSSVRQVP